MPDMKLDNHGSLVTHYYRMDRDSHRVRHLELHNALDELIADFVMHNPDSLPGNTILMDFMRWSYSQTLGPAMLDPSETAE